MNSLILRDSIVANSTRRASSLSSERRDCPLAYDPKLDMFFFSAGSRDTFTPGVPVVVKLSPKGRVWKLPSNNSFAPAACRRACRR